MRFWEKVLYALSFRWRHVAFVTSTIVEIDRDTGEVVKIPGLFPEAERSLLYRARMAFKRTKWGKRIDEFHRLREAHQAMLNRDRWGDSTNWDLLPPLTSVGPPPTADTELPVGPKTTSQATPQGIPVGVRITQVSLPIKT